MKYVKIILLLNLLIPINTVQAQLFHRSASLEGKIIDDSTRQGISFVQLLNETKHNWAICEENGHFNIPADKGDTLVFSVLGYLGKVVIVSDSDMLNGLTVELLPRTYEIDHVKIFGFRSYSDFKEQFKDLKLPETRIDIVRKNLAIISKDVAVEAYNNKKISEKLNQNGIQMIGIPIFSNTKEDKQRIHLQEIIKQENKQQTIEKKYNREIIADLTHLKDDELTDFMTFCNFSEEYLLKTDQYDILVEVLKKLKLYKEMKKSGFIYEEGSYGLYPEA